MAGRSGDCVDSRSILFLAAAGAAAVLASGCGGGGGSITTQATPAPAPAPAPSPAPAPAGPAAIDSTKVALAQLPISCTSIGINCFSQVSAFVDSSGELTALWTELLSAGTSRLVASNVATGSNAPLSSGPIEVAFAPTGQLFRARPLGNRRFVVLHKYTFGSSSMPEARSRIVDMKTSGTPDVAAAVVLPQILQQSAGAPRMWQDSAGQIYSVASLPQGPMTPPPFPAVALGSGVTLQTTVPFQSPLAQLDSSRDADFPQSADPRILVGLVGRQLSGGDTAVYVSEQRLLDGTVSTPLKMSTQPVVTQNAQLTCLDVEQEPAAYAGAGPTQYAIAWRQLNPAGNGCDLYVNGQRVNTGVQSVNGYRINVGGSGIVAVWDERSATPPSGRVLWSRRDAGSTTWSVPAPLTTEVPVTGTDQQLLLLVRGPAGAMAAVWSVTPSNVGTLVSKYSNGAWTTVRTSALSSGARAVAINAQGQGAVIFESPAVCNAGGECKELQAYRF